MTELFTSHAPRTLEERHQAINTLFGFQPWRTRITKSTRPPSPVKMKEEPKDDSGVPKSLGNILYVIFFGWWTSLIYLVMGILLSFLIVTRRYGELCLELSVYFFYPFGKYIERSIPEYDESAFLLGSSVNREPSTSASTSTTRPSGGTADMEGAEGGEASASSSASRKDEATSKSGYDDSYSHDMPAKPKIPWQRYVFYVFGMPVLGIVHGINWVICWFLVVLIPVAKVHSSTLRLLLTEPEALSVGSELPPPPGADIALCTYEAVNRRYLGHTVGGMNVVLVNLIPFCVFAVILGYAPPEKWRHENSILIFIICLLSVVPLSYYIGTAVSSVSAQSSFAVGAVLNATFGSTIELILYFFAIQKGLHDLVQQAVTGSLLGLMLLLPGLSMIVSGFKYKILRFNTNAAGVSAVMLFIAITGDMTPTVFYQLYGRYELHCEKCEGFDYIAPEHRCFGCRNEQNLADDPIFKDHTKPLEYFCACLLPFAYIIGLIFTLKTHSHFYQKKGEHKDPEEDPNEHGESVPEWSTSKCVVVLVVGTIMFAMIAETLTDSIHPFIKKAGISERFAGLTFIALVPNIAEFVNAILFAYNGNITLALEIGNVAAIQVSMIQMPAVVLMSYLTYHNNIGKSFTLVFPYFDVFAVFVSVLVIQYISIDGRCNYFEGSALVLIFVILLAAFYYMP
eukprot:TRINITY_DN337_c0_g1_i1.p1 TRINITY_DN337_c0_g1~~TRINITY_DN337_c0_g1_i1.p1  ORF type:complete len:682 (-),score=138.92 TRINITY_DN337_c0_g1_i1:94-2139(-)